MVMVVVDDSSLQADSKPNSGGLVWGSASAWCCSAITCGHDDNTINIVIISNIIIIISIFKMLTSAILDFRN